MRRAVTGMLFAAAVLLMSSYEPAYADDTPRESCAGIAILLAQNRLAEVPDAVRKASKGEINLEDGAFKNLQPVIDAGPVKVNDFLAEKNYNDTLLKIWHLLYFGWDSLYLSCEYLNIDGQWVLIGYNYDSNQEDIDLP